MPNVGGAIWRAPLKHAFNIDKSTWPNIQNLLHTSSVTLRTAAR